MRSEPLEMLSISGDGDSCVAHVVSNDTDDFGSGSVGELLGVPVLVVVSEPGAASTMLPTDFQGFGEERIDGAGRHSPDSFACTAPRMTFPYLQSIDDSPFT